MTSTRALVAVTLSLAALSWGCAPTQNQSAVELPAGSSESTSPQESERSTNDAEVQLSPTPTPDVRLPRAEPGKATVVSRVKTKDPVVFLTIDDGGHEEAPTAKILRKEKVPVTSFLSVKFVEDDPGFYGDISEQDGQTIQDHTVTHPQLPLLGYEAQRSEICEARRVLQQWYKEKPWMLRPPYGEYNETTQLAADSCGLDYVVLWTVNMPEGGKGSFQYKSGTGFVPGDIILAHWRPDLHRDIRRGLRDIRSQGFEVAALQDYLPRR